MREIKTTLMWTLMAPVIIIAMIVMATIIGVVVIKDTVLEWRKSSWSEIGLIGVLLAITGTVSYLSLAPEHVFLPIPTTLVATAIGIGLLYLMTMLYIAAKAELND